MSIFRCMAIVTCEHHSGMGLCPSCAREQENLAERARDEARTILRRKRSTLEAAADAFEQAGNHYLARLIRAEIPLR